MKDLKGKDMQTQIATETVNAVPDIAPAEKKRLIQAEINLDLWKAVEATRKKGDYNIRKVMEFGLKAFLIRYNPEAAAQLGIIKPKK